MVYQVDGARNNEGPCDPKRAGVAPEHNPLVGTRLNVDILTDGNDDAGRHVMPLGPFDNRTSANLLTCVIPAILMTCGVTVTLSGGRAQLIFIDEDPLRFANI